MNRNPYRTNPKTRIRQSSGKKGISPGKSAPIVGMSDDRQHPQCCNYLQPLLYDEWYGHYPNPDYRKGGCPPTMWFVMCGNPDPATATDDEWENGILEVYPARMKRSWGCAWELGVTQSEMITKATSVATTDMGGDWDLDLGDISLVMPGKRFFCDSNNPDYIAGWNYELLKWMTSYYGAGWSPEWGQNWVDIGPEELLHCADWANPQAGGDGWNPNSYCKQCCGQDCIDQLNAFQLDGGDLDFVPAGLIKDSAFCLVYLNPEVQARCTPADVPMQWIGGNYWLNYPDDWESFFFNFDADWFNLDDWQQMMDSAASGNFVESTCEGVSVGRQWIEPEGNVGYTMGAGGRIGKRTLPGRKTPEQMKQINNRRNKVRDNFTPGLTDYTEMQVDCPKCCINPGTYLCDTNHGIVLENKCCETPESSLYCVVDNSYNRNVEKECPIPSYCSVECRNINSNGSETDITDINDVNYDEDLDHLVEYQPGIRNRGNNNGS